LEHIFIQCSDEKSNTELSNYQAAQTVKLLKLLSSAAPATVAPVEPQQ